MFVTGQEQAGDRRFRLSLTLQAKTGSLMEKPLVLKKQ